MINMKSWLGFIKSCYVRCAYLILFVVMTWLILRGYENASIFFVLFVLALMIAATKIIYDKETTIERLKQKMEKHDIEYKNIFEDD